MQKLNRQIQFFSVGLTTGSYHRLENCDCELQHGSLTVDPSAAGGSVMEFVADGGSRIYRIYAHGAANAESFVVYKVVGTKADPLTSTDATPSVRFDGKYIAVTRTVTGGGYMVQQTELIPPPGGKWAAVTETGDKLETQAFGRRDDAEAYLVDGLNNNQFKPVGTVYCASENVDVQQP